MAILQSESTSESHSKIFFTSLSWCRAAREFRVLQTGLWSGRVFCRGLSPRIPLATTCVYNILVITSRETLKYFLFRNFKYPFVETHGLKSFLTAYTGEWRRASCKRGQVTDRTDLPHFLRLIKGVFDTISDWPCFLANPTLKSLELHHRQPFFQGRLTAFLLEAINRLSYKITWIPSWNSLLDEVQKIKCFMRLFTAETVFTTPKLLTYFIIMNALASDNILFSLFFLFEKGFTYPKLAFNSLSSQRWPWTSDSLAFSSWMLGFWAFGPSCLVGI